MKPNLIAHNDGGNTDGRVYFAEIWEVGSIATSHVHHGGATPIVVESERQSPCLSATVDLFLGLKIEESQVKKVNHQSSNVIFHVLSKLVVEWQCQVSRIYRRRLYCSELCDLDPKWKANNKISSKWADAAMIFPLWHLHWVGLDLVIVLLSVVLSVTIISNDFLLFFQSVPYRNENGGPDPFSPLVPRFCVQKKTCQQWTSGRCQTRQNTKR